MLTALLLAHLRAQGVDARAMKPFCSGARDDAIVLHRLQGGGVSLDEVNPYFFKEPVAPLASYLMARKKKRDVHLPSLQQVVNGIEQVARKCDVLLVEGAGGIEVPLDRSFSVLNLIEALECSVIVVARNALGTINHTVLTVNALQRTRKKNLTVVMMGVERPDASEATNLEIIKAILLRIPIFSVPFMGRKPLSQRHLKNNVVFLKKTLAQMRR